MTAPFCLLPQFADTVMKSSIAPHNSDPTWRKEELVFDLPKGKCEEGVPVLVGVEVRGTQSPRWPLLKLCAGVYSRILMTVARVPHGHMGSLPLVPASRC
jgi:hypothetical protein